MVHKNQNVVIFTARKRSLRRLCFYTCLSVILFTGGVCLSACWDTPPPTKETPCQGDPPAKETPNQGDPLPGRPLLSTRPSYQGDPLPKRPHARETPLCQGDPPPRRPPARETPCQGDPAKETPARETPCQGDPPAKETPLPGRPPPGPHPRGKLRGIRSRPTPKGEIQGDQIQAHTQGGNSGGSDPSPHPRGKFRGIRSRPTPKGEIQGDQDQTPPDDYCRGRYASYWNAFLLCSKMTPSEHI